MVCAPVRSITPSLKLGDYLSVQAHKPWRISHIGDCRDNEGNSYGYGHRGSYTSGHFI